MTNFNYTDGGPVNSTALAAVYYDDVTNRVLVDSGNNSYIYDGVPFREYRAFVTAPSIGSAWRPFLKTYGPSQRLRWNSKPTPVARGAAARGTDKDLKVTADTKVTAGRLAPTAINQYFSLSGDGIAAGNIKPGVIGTTPARSYTVVFNVNGDATDRKYNPKGVTSVDSAVAALTEVATVLGTEFKVKGVYVSFE